jgi:hypothetical protein
MEDDIRKYDEMDMKAFGLITQSMLSCPPGQLILAQMVPDEIGCGLHARPAMALLDTRFDRRDVRTLAERLGEVYETHSEHIHHGFCVGAHEPDHEGPRD